MSEKRCNYYRVQAPWGEEVEYITNNTAKRYTDEFGWTVEKLKVKKYDDETFKKVVKEVLKYNGTLGTTDLWKGCLKNELLLQRKTFLKRLNNLEDAWWLERFTVGNCYLWSVKK